MMTAGQAKRERVRLELDRDAGIGERGQVDGRADHQGQPRSRRPTPAAIAVSTAGMASAMTRPAARSWPMTVSRARVIPRSGGPERQGEDHGRTGPSAAAAAAMVSVMRSPAPCWIGELASVFSTPVRNVVAFPGSTPVGHRGQPGRDRSRSRWPGACWARGAPAGPGQARPAA